MVIREAKNQQVPGQINKQNPFIGFIILKTISWAKGFKAKIGFEKYALDPKILVKICALESWAQAGCFEYNEPLKLKTFFVPIMGVL